MDRRSRAGRVADGSHDRVVRSRRGEARGGLPPDEAAAVISLERREGRPLRIGHRGAATLAPANTLPSLRAALEVGVDLIEFDVVAGSDGTLVCSHSPGEIQPETPTLDEILALLRRGGASGRRSPRPQAVRTRARCRRGASPLWPRRAELRELGVHAHRACHRSRRWSPRRDHDPSCGLRHLRRRTRRPDRPLGPARASPHDPGARSSAARRSAARAPS